MELILPGGDSVRISPAMARALREAESDPVNPRTLRVRFRVGVPTLDELRRRGLVAAGDGADDWRLTERGRQARARLPAGPDAPCGDAETLTLGVFGGRPLRATLHPAIGREDADRLRAALGGRRHGGAHAQARTAPADAPVGKRTRLAYLSLAAFAYATMLVAGPVSALIVLFAGAVVVLVVRGIAGAPSADTGRSSAPEDVTAAFAGRFVEPRSLDDQARDLLGRAQRAVDTVLESPLHDRGLLLDAVRNRVVLGDIEWSVARSLERHTSSRRLIAAVPTPGERSRRAAERARAALEEDVRAVEWRIGRLEDYAEKVAAAELEIEDRRSAARLDEITESTLRAGAAAPHEDVTLTSLVEAQEMALELASLIGP
ncbi:hypothetical protein DFP74_3777 [Nocardiopsis sp. Huas11]|uniref:hypothetical protein n=1 Tax=Nocardiopsis sp. Huas11 TaxID=2183912 RepID=UPI000EB55BE4|nr:hypothetical protein [Nocardiopsis sp. Huas11]RKS08088.1 hypothetical protein DFP74_3777 [Nocardiopsis sp. Huas11]